MSVIIQLNNKPFSCKKNFIRNNPSMNEFFLNGSYIITLEGVNIDPHQDLITKIFLDQYYQISKSDLSFLTELNKKIKSIDLQIKIDQIGTKTPKTTDNIVNHPDISILVKLEDTLLNLSDDNFNTSCLNIESMLREEKINTITFIRTVFGTLFPCIDKIDLYIDTILQIDRTVEIKTDFCDKIVKFCEKSKGIFSREMCFIINKLVDRGLIEYNGFNKHSPYFMHYMKKEEISKLCRSKASKSLYLPEIRGDNFQQHRYWCLQGKNEHKIAEFIRKDDIDQIQKSDIDFINYNHLPPSIYECHEIFALRAKHAEYAALYGAEKCFDFFMENVKYTSTNDKLARCAIIGGNNNIIKKCIKLNLMTQNCLETALIYHRNELFEWLLDQKDSFSISKNFFKMSLFHGCFRAIQIMIQHGVEPSSFIYHAVTHTNYSLFHWNFLFDPDVNFKNGLLILNACKHCSYKMLKLLAKYPSADFNCRNKFDGCSCLHIACTFHDDVKFVKMILERMNNDVITAKQKEGFTALHNACVNGSIEIVKLLLDTGLFNIGEVTENGHNSLYLAAANKNEKLVNFLLTTFSEPIKEFIDNETIQLCYDLCNVQIAALLFEMTNVTPSEQTLPIACGKNKVEFVDYLFEMVAQNNWKLDCSNDDFILACKNGFSQIALMIIKNDIKISPNETLNGKTSLHYACKNGMKEVVEFLVSYDQIDLNLPAKRSRKSQDEKEQKELLFGFQEENDDFCYDDEYEDDEEVKNDNNNINDDENQSAVNESMATENLVGTGENSVNEENLPKSDENDNKADIIPESLKSKPKQPKESRRKIRRENRQKMREERKKSLFNLSDPIDQETESYIFNEELDQYPIDKRRFDKFINEVKQKRHGRSAISIACRNGYLDIVNILLETGKVDLTSTNLLFDAIYSSNLELIVYIIDFVEQHNKEAPNQKLPLTSLDETPLQFACRVIDNPDVFKLVYDHFTPTPNEEAFNSYYYSEFQRQNNEFYYSSQIEVFENNFDFDYYRNENLSNLFKIAIENRHPKVARFLLDKIIKTEEDPRILSDCLLTACKTPYKDIVRAIIKSPGLSQLFSIENLEDVIYEIIMKGRLDNLKILISDLEVDIGNMIFQQTKNILHIASKSPNSEVLEYIISLNKENSININMNESDCDGFTALMLAAKKKNLRNTEILFFEKDINRSIIAHKQSIFSLCYKTGNICFADLLRQVNSFNPKDESLILHSISSGGNVDLLQWVIDNKVVSINQSAKFLTKEGFNCLHIAIINGCIELIDKFVKLGLFDLNTRATDGRTPLQIAVDSRNFKSVQFLLNSKVVSINASYPKKKKTVLHKAVKEKMFDIVCLLLLNKEIKLDSRDSKDRTPEQLSDSIRIQKMFEIRKNEKNDEEMVKKLSEMIDKIHKADQIKEKFRKFVKLNQKIRFDYHATSYEFDEQNELIGNLVYNDDNFCYRCDSSSSDDDEDYDQDIDDIIFVEKKKNKPENKRSRARYRNRKKFKKSQKQEE